MASAYRYRGKWVAKWKDADGRWRYRATHAHVKADALRLARDLEAKGERQRHGLEAKPPADGGGTVSELLTWWLEHYSEGTPGHRTNESAVRKHLQAADLAALTLAALKPAHVERLLQAKSAELGPQSVNHLRGYLSRAFTRAKEAGRWAGMNPVLDVRRRKVPRRSFDYLRREEVGPVLAALAPRWRPIFAAAIYTGGREGELCGLRKADIDLGAARLTFARSWGRDTTKNGKARAVPVHPELLPVLRQAVDSSPSDLVFPRPDGLMHSENVDFPGILRRALARAGIVAGYQHVCRARVNGEGKRDRSAPRCAHAELAPDPAPRRCLVHGDRLWPKARVRQIRFHDLRHTCASLLLQSGCSLPAVSLILGHGDVRITLDRYGHLAPDFMRGEIEKLRLGGVELEPGEAGPAGLLAPAAPGGNKAPCCAGVAGAESAKKEGRNPGRDRHEIPALELGAGNGIRTRDPQLGKLMLYQLSYSRATALFLP